MTPDERPPVVLAARAPVGILGPTHLEQRLGNQLPGPLVPAVPRYGSGSPMTALPFEELPPPPTPPEPKRLTERDVLDKLHVRYGAVSMNARRYAVAEHVADRPSWAMRRADFIAQDCYQGLALHGHEIKVSRSDWLRELADPSKAETFARYCDYWWLVVSDRTIVRPGELPHGWGLLAASSRALRCVTPAQKRDPEPMPAHFRAALLRATAATATARTKEVA